ncbi:hypothetical protein HNY73_006254 [Argiope bruennichi]|uniref:Endonuclease/exonuclease/phosphatase domain-containing protein n=1 Tax=Argiope bruennichi TaxID=94029 RepID=A0A8T0FJF1_ARGBR|nr:hypothetical protein HNY73_006254 [Argiope bruennichi]
MGLLSEVPERGLDVSPVQVSAVFKLPNTSSNVSEESELLTELGFLRQEYHKLIAIAACSQFCCTFYHILTANRNLSFITLLTLPLLLILLNQLTWTITWFGHLDYLKLDLHKSSSALARSNVDYTNTASDITTVRTPTTSAAEVSVNPNNSDCGSFKINLNAFFNEIEYKFIMDKVKSILAFLHAIPNETFDTISEIAQISSEALIFSTSRVDHLTAQLASHGSNLTENDPCSGGIRNKFKELEYFVMDWAPDVIAIQETHLRPTDKIKIPNYCSYRTPVSISIIYRPPQGKMNTSELHRIRSQTGKIIAIGNFNAKQSSWSTGHPNSRHHHPQLYCL